MADTTTVSEPESVQTVITAYPKASANYEMHSQSRSQFDIENFNCLDTNGALVHSDCDILPNNNVCTNMGLSHCYVDGDCSSSIQKQAMPLYGLDSPYGESSSRASLQEFDTHSIHPAGKYIS